VDDIRSRLATAIYREHALRRMLARGVSPRLVAEALTAPDAEVIERYERPPFGSCCLILGWSSTRQPIHVVIGLTQPLQIMTAYDPTTDPRQRWEADCKTRRPRT